MKYSHKVVLAQSVPARVERCARNVLEGEVALPVPALKPPNFKAAVWALAIEKDFELPVGHDDAPPRDGRPGSWSDRLGGTRQTDVKASWRHLGRDPLGVTP